MVYNVRMKRINLMFPTQLIARLKLHTDKTGISYSEIIRRAVDDWLTQRGA